MIIVARTEFATYVGGDCVSVTCGQTLDIPREQAEALVAGGLAEFAPAAAEPPETKPAGTSPETKVVEVPEVKVAEPAEPPEAKPALPAAKAPSIPRQRSRK